MIKHQWDEVDLPKNLKDVFEKKFICSRGDCKCERLLSKSGFFSILDPVNFTVQCLPVLETYH